MTSARGRCLQAMPQTPVSKVQHGREGMRRAALQESAGCRMRTLADQISLMVFSVSRLAQCRFLICSRWERMSSERQIAARMDSCQSATCTFADMRHVERAVFLHSPTAKSLELEPDHHAACRHGSRHGGERCGLDNLPQAHLAVVMQQLRHARAGAHADEVFFPCQIVLPQAHAQG